MPENNKTSIDHEQIKELLAHRYPMLLIDRVVNYESMKFVEAIKNVTANEPQFQGHFPNKAIFPGVLIIEAMAQATAILGAVSSDRVDIAKHDLYYLVSVDNCRFRRLVLPGDVMQIKVEAIGEPKRNMWKFNCLAIVDDKVAAEAQIMSAAASA